MESATFRCPGCHSQNTLNTIESRKVDFYVRRRKKCSVCDKRVTTYELPSEQFEDLKNSQVVLNNLKKVLEAGGLSTVTSRKPNCALCIYMDEFEGCTMGFPEAGGSFAEECNLYKELV